jgi:hypothetical protein
VSRPEGRTPSPELIELRKATRALRLHLDELPIDFNEGLSGDRFLAGLAFMSGRQRYDCAQSMIGAGFGGTVLGALARSVFVDGLRRLWLVEAPATRRLSILGDLLEERSRICRVLRTTGSSCGNLPRWLMPLPDIAELTGQSMTIARAPTRDWKSTPEFGAAPPMASPSGWSRGSPFGRPDAQAAVRHCHCRGMTLWLSPRPVVREVSPRSRTLSRTGRSRPGESISGGDTAHPVKRA